MAEKKKKEASLDLHDKIEDLLDSMYDPEIPVSIWQLGLIYDIKIDSKKNVLVTMTLTSPSCPVAGTLPREIERRVGSIEGVESSKVEVTFDPPWTPDHMSEEARFELGML